LALNYFNGSSIERQEAAGFDHQPVGSSTTYESSRFTVSPTQSLSTQNVVDSIDVDDDSVSDPPSRCRR
jgi:hypothetical protein